MTKTNKIQFLNSKDPLQQLFKSWLRLNNFYSVIIITGIAVIVELLLSFVASASYTGTGVKADEAAFIVFAILRAFLFVPFLATFYFWQPNAILMVYNKLEENNILNISHIDKSTSQITTFVRNLDKRIDHVRWSIYSVILIVIFWFILLQWGWPIEFNTSGRTAFWYDVKAYLIAFIANFSIWLYMLWMVIFKQLQSTYSIWLFFKQHTIKVHPLYADNCGGFGPLGQFISRSTIFAIGFGVLAIIYTMQVYTRGLNPLYRGDLVALWLVYILMVPLNLMYPVLSAHQSMKSYRDQELNKVSLRFDQLMLAHSVESNEETSILKEANERLTELQTRHSIIEESIPVWPISLNALRGFSITASLPALSGLIPIALELSR